MAGSVSIGFLGAGRMALALAKGLVAAGVASAPDVMASSPKDEPSTLEEMKKEGFRTSYDNGRVVSECRVVILSCKPPVVPRVLGEIGGAVTPDHLLISIAMGVPLRSLEQMLPRNSRVIRAVPNTPALVGQGASVFCCGSASLASDRGLASRLLAGVGICREVPESLLDAATGLSGSGPAYIYLAIEALADGGVEMGLPRDLAQELAAGTVAGAAKMVLDSGRHPGALKDDVCSPGGSTIRAVHLLEKSGFRSALMDAVQAATLRAREMAAGHQS